MSLSKMHLSENEIFILGTFSPVPGNHHFLRLQHLNLQGAQRLVPREGRPEGRKREKGALTIGGDKFVGVFSELQTDILFTSFASPWGIQGLAKSLD